MSGRWRPGAALLIAGVLAAGAGVVAAVQPAMRAERAPAPDAPAAGEVAPATQAAAVVPVPDVRVYVGDELVAFDTEPVMVSGRLLVPMRAIFEALGAGVYWDASTQAVTAERDGRRVWLQVGAAVALVSGERVALDAAPRVHRGRVLVPLRFVGVALGAAVAWDDAARAVRIAPGPTAADAPALLTRALAGGQSYDLAGTAAVRARVGAGAPAEWTEAVRLQVRGRDFVLEQWRREGGAPAELVVGRRAEGERQQAWQGGQWVDLPVDAPRPEALTVLGAGPLPAPGLTPADAAGPGAPALAHAVAGPGLAELALPLDPTPLVADWTARLPDGVAPAGPAVVEQARALYWVRVPDGALTEMAVAVSFGVPLDGGARVLRVELAGRFRVTEIGNFG